MSLHHHSRFPIRKSKHATANRLWGFFLFCFDRLTIEAELDRDEASACLDMDDLTRSYIQRPIDLRIYRPGLFQGYSGLGIFDLYHAPISTLQSERILDLTFNGQQTIADVQKKVAALIQLEGDRRRCQLFRFDALSGVSGRARIRASETVGLAREKAEWPSMQYWLHLLPVDMDGLPSGREVMIGPVLAPQDLPPPPPPLPPPPPPAFPPRIPRPTFATEGVAADSAAASTVGDADVVSDAHTDGAVAAAAAAAAPPALTSQQREEHEPPTVSSLINEDAPMPDASEASTAQPEHQDNASPEVPEAGGPTNRSIQRSRPFGGRRSGRFPRAGRGSTESGFERRRSSELMAQFCGEHVFVFLKRFDVWSQSLVGLGGCLFKADDIIMVGVRRLLGLPDGQTMRMWEEVHPDEARKLSVERSFRDEEICHGAILMMGENITAEQ